MAKLRAFTGRTFEERPIDYGNVPVTHISAERLMKGVFIYELLVEAGMAQTRSEARRLIRQGAVRIGEVRVTEERAVLSAWGVLEVRRNALV